MKGDFSKWNFDRKRNFNGVLHQQGRVLLDNDWNAQTRITNNWQDQAGRDIIGRDVVAIPADEPDGFKVESAEIAHEDGDDKVRITVNSGIGWVDGLLAYLDEEADVSRVATYLQPPIQDPPSDESTINEGVRDAVILEVWREAINGFQSPNTLIEPALGGPDTTERVHTAMAFRLFRLEDEDTCQNIRARLKDDFSQKGKLAVTLQPTTGITRDCPVVGGGGYTGFEHNLYRIEIAQVDSGVPMFKWSQFNGGLVGRGIFHSDTEIVEITANLQAIITSGLNEFYLEAVECDEDLGHWKVTYGAEVTLNSDNELDLPGTPIFGAIPASNDCVFFRLWNGIRNISEFPISTDPTELRDGIRLEFDPTTGANYVPGDYWTFPVRAGEITNPEVLIGGEPPEGIHYHRAPLAILNWSRGGVGSRVTDEQINDCRRIFRPLTNQNVCCFFTVGDGKSSFGDFNSIAEAVRHLPSSGGEICLLPGFHEANVIIRGKKNIKIRGCGKKTRVTPGTENRENPIFHIVDSNFIMLENIHMISLGGTAIFVEGTRLGASQGVEICDNRIFAYENAILVKRGIRVNIHHNKIRMLDRQGAGIAVDMLAEDSIIERNDIGVVPAESIPPVETPGSDVTPDPAGPCTDPEVIYSNVLYFEAYINIIWSVWITSPPANPFEARGGIQIESGCERIKILDNRINGGAGNGITLGSSADLSNIFDVTIDRDSDETEDVISHSGGGLQGTVSAAGNPLPHTAFSFTRASDGLALDATTNESGSFSLSAEEGEYRVSISSLNYRVHSIEVERPDAVTHVPIPIYHITLVEVERELPNLEEILAFIYEIRIDLNEISNMGLSGIGISRMIQADQLSRPGVRTASSGSLYLLYRTFARFGNPIIGLSIYRNSIFNCLQNPFNEQMRTEVRSTGLGGISLGMCEDICIRENRIENNGTSHIYPICGIYVAYGEHLDITQNYVIANGPFVPDTNADLDSGKRGGIVLTASSLSIFDRLTNQNFFGSNGRPAVRIHDNVVDQPVGRALVIGAFGPVSILDNQFNSELSGPGVLERLIGAVLILNIGGSYRINPVVKATTRVSSDNVNRTDTTDATAATNAIGYTHVNPESVNLSRRPEINLRLPNGNILFNSNQTRVVAPHLIVVIESNAL